MKGKPLDPVGAEDKDIDNDGDHDKSDKYLHKRRKAISKSMSMKKESKCSCEDEMDDEEDYDDEEEESSMKKKKSSKSMKKEGYEEDKKSAPFAGPYRDASKPRKDQYGNVIKDKNAAKSLAKKGMAGVKKEEVEQVQEVIGTTTGYSDSGPKVDAATRKAHQMRNVVTKGPRTGKITKDIQNRLKDKIKARMTKEEAEQVAEISKKTLGSYIKKASHDVATKGALVRHFATKSRDERSKDNYVQSRKDDETANKLFNKSWKRRQGMAKAVDRLTKEEVESKRLAGIDVTIRKLAKESVVVQSDQWGVGESIPGKFRVAESDNGLKYVTHCDVMFAHGIEFDVPANELVIHEADTRAMHYKNGTKPEGMMDKESAGSKKFAAQHDYGKAELVYDDEAGHEDATKAGRVVKQTKPNRGDQRVGHLKPKD